MVLNGIATAQPVKPDQSTSIIKPVVMGDLWKPMATGNHRMETEFLDFDLIRDAEFIAEVCAEAASLGWILICQRCANIEALITVFLVCDRDEQAWPLCEVCLRELPLEGPIV